MANFKVGDVLIDEYKDNFKLLVIVTKLRTKDSIYETKILKICYVNNGWGYYKGQIILSHTSDLRFFSNKPLNKVLYS